VAVRPSLVVRAEEATTEAPKKPDVGPKRGSQVSNFFLDLFIQAHGLDFFSRKKPVDFQLSEHLGNKISLENSILRFF